MSMTMISTIWMNQIPMTRAMKKRPSIHCSRTSNPTMMKMMFLRMNMKTMMRYMNNRTMRCHLEVNDGERLNFFHELDQQSELLETGTKKLHKHLAVKSFLKHVLDSFEEDLKSILQGR